ncbi:type II toxin-antitoxin system death-on-curing family toxin [Streptomyces sp. NPDC049099]|uniref:type II toxin-antitoxin system death-on-curing family toxin n=1 Tax=Streptomyces sp. NPDC049099 TaxID=3155768 RepID=UPI00341F25F0
MQELPLSLDAATRQALDDLADASGRRTDAVVLEAVHRYLHEEQAGALLHAVASNHPLVDGNKRTAWPATATFLACNGVDLADIDQDTAYDLAIDVASGDVSDVTAIAGRLRRL